MGGRGCRGGAIAIHEVEKWLKPLAFKISEFLECQELSDVPCFCLLFMTCRHCGYHPGADQEHGSGLKPCKDNLTVPQ